MNVSGQIFQIQNFSLHDGHGIRTVIFFSGCPLRCRWCANPEGMTREPSLAFYKNLCAGCGRCTAVCPDHLGIDWENPDIRKNCRSCGACASVCPTGARTLYGRRITPQELLDELEENLNQLKKNRKSISPALSQKVSICIRNQEESVGRQMDAVRQSIESQLNACEVPEDFESMVENLPSFLNLKFTRIGKSVDDALRRELLNAAEEEYEAYVQDMEDLVESMSDDRSFKFVSATIHLDNMSIGVNLEKFESDCKRLQDQINELEQQKEQAEVNAIQARRMERNLQEKQDELKDLRQSKQFIQENFVAPEAVTRTKEVDASYWRSGLLGIVGNLLFGKKPATRWIDDIDSSAKDAAIEQHRKRLAEVDEEINRIKEEQQNLPKLQESSEDQELKFRRAQEKLKKREEELRKLQEAHLQDIAQKTKRASKR